jgi:hypothetical protein
MVKNNTHTVDEYLASLPVERREIIIQVRNVILKNLPTGFEESIQYGMIAYVVPLSVLPHTYNGQPLQLAALASQKNYMSLYLMAVYGDPALNEWFITQYQASGKKLDMGKSCVRFKKIEDLPLDLIGNVIGKVSLEKYVARYIELKGK